MVRHEQTRDHAALAKVIAQTIVKDFGLVATVVKKPDAETAELVFRGSKLGTPEGGWPHKGDLFALSKIAVSAGGAQGTRVPWAVLRLDEDVKEGSAFGTVFHRHADPLGDGSALGYRCLQLATISAPLHVRMIKAGEGRPIPERGLRVHVNRRSFDPEEADQVEGATNEDGYLDTGERTSELFSRLAFVRVVGADGRDRAHIPVPILDDRTVVCTLALGPDVIRDPGAMRLSIWVRDLYRSVRGQAELFRELGEQLKNPDAREKALASAEAGSKRTEGELQQFQQTRAALAANFGGKLDLSVGDQYLEELRQGQAKLQTFINQQKDILVKQKDQGAAWKQLQDKAQEALLAEQQADFGRAIELYKQVVAGGATDPRLRQHLDSLEATWKLKDADHAAARKFVYEVWPQYDLAQMAARNSEALRALEKVKSVGDTLTPQKLLKVALAHADKLREEAAKLHPEDSEEDRKRVASLAAVNAQLGTVIRETAAYLKSTLKENAKP